MTQESSFVQDHTTNFSILFYFLQEPTLDSNGVEIKEPLDTIFVKSVRESGPAHLAGLQCGEYCKFRFSFVEFLWPFYPLNFCGPFSLKLLQHFEQNIDTSHFWIKINVRFMSHGPLFLAMQ